MSEHTNPAAAGHRPVGTFSSRLATHRSEQGLALADVLIGTSLFVLIALIAIQAIGQFRLRGYESGAISDVKQVAGAVTAALGDQVGVPTDLAAARNLSDVNYSRGNTLTSYTLDEGSGDFATCVMHDSGAWAYYESEHGKITEHGRKDAPAKCGGNEGGGPVSGACKVYASTWWDDRGVLHVNSNIYGVEDGWAVPCTTASNADFAAFLGGFAGASVEYNDEAAYAALPGVSEADFEAALDAWMAQYPGFTRDDGTSDDCDPTLGPC